MIHPRELFRSVITAALIGCIHLHAAAQAPEEVATEVDRLLEKASKYAGRCNTLNPAQCDTALSLALKGLDLGRSGAASVNPARLISAYALAGDICHRQRQFDRAKIFLQRGIELADSTTGRNIREVADCFYFLGLIEEYKQAFANALQYHQQALGIRERLQPAYPAGLALSHQRLGACYGNIKDREREKQHLNYAQWICDQNPEINPGIRTGIAIDIVASMAAAGEYREADTLATRLLANPALSLEQQSAAWSKLANIYHKQNQLQLASKAYQRSIELLEKAKGPYDSWLTWAYSDWGQVWEQQGDTASAIRCYRKVEEIALHNFRYHYAVGTARYRIASMRFRNHAYEAALAEVQGALVSLCPGFNDTDPGINPPLDNSLNYDYFRRALLLKARILSELANATSDTLYLKHAGATYRHCLDLVDRFRNDLPTIGARTSDLAEIRHIYEEALQIELKAGKGDSRSSFAPAFSINEKSKSFLLHAGIRENQAIQFHQIPDEILRKELQLRQQISQSENKLNLETGKRQNAGDSLVMNLTAKLFDARRQYDVFIREIEDRYPDYYRLKHDLQVESATAVQTRLLAPGQALLEYFVGDSSIFIFLIKKDDYRIVTVNKDFPLEDWVKRLRFGIYGYHTAQGAFRTAALRDSAATAYIEAAVALYEKLLAPVDSLLPGRVVIVPDGVLGYIPFEALLTARPERKDRYQSYPYFGRVKGREHSIGYCYSATLLREMTGKQHRRKPEKMLGAFAPFYYGDTTLPNGLAELLRARKIEAADPDTLKYSGPEATAARSMFGGDVYLGDDATEGCFNRVAGDYRVVHLSTHGRADDRSGDYSYLMFSPRRDSAENGLLYVRDIYNLSLNADLVVLSACETGIGELKRGEGIISLARAFAYAGAKSIVTTLWSVDDAKTRDLMVFFYQNLKNGMTKDEALARARNDYFSQHKGLDAHPYFWAGFVGIGDMAAFRK